MLRSSIKWNVTGVEWPGPRGDVKRHLTITYFNSYIYSSPLVWWPWGSKPNNLSETFCRNRKMYFANIKMSDLNLTQRHSDHWPRTDRQLMQLTDLFFHRRLTRQEKHILFEYQLAASVSGSGIVHAVSLSHCHDLLGHLNRTESLLPLPRRLCFHPCPFVFWLVGWFGQQDC